MKIFITAVIALFGSVLVVNAGAETVSCEHKIILLPQSDAHHSMVNGTPVARSQFMVARHLDNFPGIEVFSENIATDMTGADFQGKNIGRTNRQMLDEVKRIFPNGLPSNYEDLNDEQKAYLMQNGGGMFALLTGRIGALYSAAESREQVSTVSTERRVLSEINSYFKVTPEAKSVVLILNPSYVIQGHDDQFPSECIVMPPDLKALFPQLSNLQN
jgi:hypothetical protein